MASPTVAPQRTEQVTLADVVGELTDAQARRIVAILGLADGVRRTQVDADGPQPTRDRLGA